MIAEKTGRTHDEEYAKLDKKNSEKVLTNEQSSSTIEVEIYDAVNGVSAKAFVDEDGNEVDSIAVEMTAHAKDQFKAGVYPLKRHKMR